MWRECWVQTVCSEGARVPVFVEGRPEVFEEVFGREEGAVWERERSGRREGADGESGRKETD